MKKENLAVCGKVDKSVESQAIFQHKKSFFKKLGVSILACFMFCLPLFAGCSTLSQEDLPIANQQQGVQRSCIKKMTQLYLRLTQELK